MIGRIQKILEGRELVVKNFFALGIIQGTNFIVPLIIMPYLISIIGIEKFGVISFIQAAMIYFYSFSDYGFTVTATKQVTLNKEKSTLLSKLFSKVVVTKLILLIASLTILLVCLFIFDVPKNQIQTYLFAFSLVVGQACLPVWFFQGLEKMKVITYVNFFSKLILLLLVYLLINKESDYKYVLLIFGLSNIIAGLVGYIYAFRISRIKFTKVTLSDISEEIKVGWRIFLANFSIASYINSNIFILGFFASDIILGYYGVAEKVFMALRQILALLTQAIYPHACQLVNKGHNHLLSFFKQLYIPFSVFFICFIGIIYYFTPEIVFFFTEDQNNQIDTLIKILLIAAIFISLNVPANITLLAYDYKKAYSQINILGSILNIILNIILANYFLAVGTAFSIIVTELIILLLFYLYLRVKKPEQKLI